MENKKKAAIILCLIMLILAGCWDAINIEDREFIIGIAIDLDEEAESGKITYKVTNQLVIPAGVGGPEGNKGGGGKAFLNVTDKGKSIYRINEGISANTSKVPYFEHIKIIVISEELAKTDHVFVKLLDTFIRDVDMRRGIKVIVTKGEAKKVLEFTTPEEKLPSIHLNKLLEQSHEQFGYLEAMTIGEIEEAHLRERSYLLPLIEVQDTLLYKSGAVFHGPEEKMVGILSPNEMQGIELASRKAIEEVVEFSYKDEEMALEIVKMNNDISVDPKDINNIKVKVKVKIVCSIKETDGRLNILNAKILKEIEHEASKKIKHSIQQALEKGQKEFNTDILSIWERMESKHYKTWKRIENDWEQGENYFAKASFDVDVHTDIYSIGTSTKTD